MSGAREEATTPTPLRGKRERDERRAHTGELKQQTLTQYSQTKYFIWILYMGGWMDGSNVERRVVAKIYIKQHSAGHIQAERGNPSTDLSPE